MNQDTPQPRLQSPLPSAKSATDARPCVACQEHTVKCTNERPSCLECREQNVACVYDDNLKPASTSRTPASKPSDSQLQAQHRAFDQLYNLLRTRSDQVANEILRRIRQGGDVHTILRHVQDGDLLLQLRTLPRQQHSFQLLGLADLKHMYRDSDNPYLASILYASILDKSTNASTQQRMAEQAKKTADHGIIYYTSYSGAQIVDRRLPSIKMAISSWTTVSSDEVLMSKLLELYFLFEYPLYPVLHRDAFLDNLIANRHEFCSSLLVNSILAAACHGLDDINDRAKFWNPRNPGYQFLAEARRLWEIEMLHKEAEQKITTIQAAMVLGLTYSANGVDRVGWGYWETGVSMAKRSGMLDETGDAFGEREAKVRMVTSWGIFAMQATSCFSFHRPPLLSSPPKYDLPSHANAASFFGEIWIKYAKSELLYPLHMGHMFLSFAALRRIMNEIGNEALGKTKGNVKQNRDAETRAQRKWAKSGGDRIGLEAAGKFHNALNKWLRNLPEELRAERVVLPGQLLMHMQYHTLLLQTITPFLPIESHFTPRDGSTSMRDYLDYSPSQVVSRSKSCLETLVHMFYRCHGFEGYYVPLLPVLTLVGFDAHDRLHTAGDEAGIRREESEGSKGKGVQKADVGTSSARATLILCALGLHMQGRNFYLSEIVYRLLKQRMDASEIQLLRDCTNIGDEEQRGENWREHVHGEWPVGALTITQDVKDLRLDKLVQATRGLELVDGLDGEDEGEKQPGYGTGDVEMDSGSS